MNNYDYVKNFESFSCSECGHNLSLKDGQNSKDPEARFREVIRGNNVKIPDDFLIPTCENCGETFMNQEISEILDPILRNLI